MQKRKDIKLRYLLIGKRQQNLNFIVIGCDNLGKCKIASLNGATTCSYFIIKNEKAIIRIESINCEGLDTVLDYIKEAFELKSIHE